MPEDRVYPLASAPSVAAEEVNRRSFASAFRGYDQAEVRAFLNQVAEELRAFARREDDLVRQLRDARERAAYPKLDEETLTEALGHEAARLLHTAHEAAADIRRKAEENAAKVLRDAHEEAARIRGAAETVLEERTTEAEAAAGEMRESALREARAVVSSARSEADETMESARARAEAITQEAGELRARLLGELMRRRRIMHAQVEQLGAGRESLLGAVTGVRRLIEEAETALVRVETEAKAEAEGAFRRALEEPEGLPPELASLTSAEAAGPAVPAEPGPALAPAPDEAAPPEPAPATPAAATDLAAVPPAEDVAEPPPSPGPPGRRPRPMAVVPPPVASAPPPEPPEPGEAPVEERRGSSLRILRWGAKGEKGDARRHHFPGGHRGAEVDEGVRIIRPASESAEVTSEPEPEPADAGRPAVEATDTEATETEAPLAGDASGPPGEEAAGDDSGGEAPSVDELFARLRADREAARRRAEEVLEERAEASGPTEPDARGGGTEAVAAAGEPAPTAVAATEAVVASADDGAGGEQPPAEEDFEVRALTRRNQLLGPLNERLSRKLKRALKDDQNDVLDRLRSSSRGRPGSVLPDADEHLARYTEAASPLVAEAFSAGCGYAAEIFPGSAGESSKGLSDESVELARALVEPLRKRLTACLEDDHREESATADAIGAAYRAWRGERVESLAMDHALGAFERGVLACLPAGASVRWVVDDDGGPCPDCDDNGLAGPTAAGDGFPTGQAHPPAHPGCRCLLAPLPA